MSFLDFIGNGPDQLSLPEILSAIPAVAGPVLMARGRKLGLPLGIGLTAFGGLGQELAQKKQTQAQHQGLAKLIAGMPGVSPQLRDSLNQFVTAGGDPSGFADEYFKNQFKQPKSSAPQLFTNQQGQEKWVDPVAGQSPPEGFSPYAKPRDGTGGATAIDRYFKEHPAATMEDYAGFVTKNRLAGDKPDKPSWRTETDPSTGATVQNAYKYNAKTGMMEEVPTSGAPAGVPAKLDTNERKQLDAVRNVSVQLPRMQGLVAALPSDTSPAVLAKEYAKFRAPFGALGAVDPRFEAYFQQIGQLKAALISSAASGFRGQNMINMLKEHIPSETDPPARAMEKIQGFDAGGFNAILQNYLGTGTPIAPSGSGATGAGGTPPKPSFDVDKAYNKDGQWYVKDKKGKFYQFNGAKWAPL